MKILAKLLRDDTEFELDLELLAGERGLDREIDQPRVQKAGLALAGFVQSIRPRRLQVLGRTEVDYLGTLDAAALRSSLDAFMTADTAAVVVTCALDVPEQLRQSADDAGVALFRTELQTSIFITRVQDFLAEHLSPEVSLHGVLIDVFGVGVLITGTSGIGKSEAALDLVLRGHRMVADDVVIVKQAHGQLFGMGNPLMRHHMEVRGLGIISVKDMFGAASVRERKRIELVAELLEWKPDLNCDRTGIDEVFEQILDVLVAKVRLPLRPGRNVAAIIEVAARNHLLKVQGHHAALELKEKIEAHLADSVADAYEEAETE